MLSAILKEVETIVSQDFLSVADCRQELIQIGHTVLRAASAKGENGIVLNAYAEETKQFVDYIENITEGALGLMDPLPSRRGMKKEESDKIRRLLFRLSAPIFLPIFPLL